MTLHVKLGLNNLSPELNKWMFKVRGSIKLGLLKKCNGLNPSPLEIGLFSATGHPLHNNDD